ncbi:MAG: IS110 family transposase, partial [Nitriliruptorales bacterium]
MGTLVGRLVVSDFRNPVRLARLGVERFRRYAARRGVQVATVKAEQLVATARVSLPAADASVAREAIGWDLALLAEIDRQLDQAAHELEQVLPATPF